MPCGSKRSELRIVRRVSTPRRLRRWAAAVASRPPPPAGRTRGPRRVPDVAAEPPEDAERDACHRQQGEQPVGIASSVGELDVVGRRDDHHHVRPDAIGTVCPLGLPVREVADLHDDRHTDLIDGERQRLLVDLARRTPRRAAAPPARSARPARRCRHGAPRRRARPRDARGRPARRSAATRRGRRRPASRPTPRGVGTSSCRARGCARGGRPAALDDYRLHGQRLDHLGVGDLVDVPGSDDPTSTSSGWAAACVFASGVRTMAYRTPSARISRTPTAALVFS